MNTREILSRMTLEEKASLCSGLGFWETKPVDRLGVPKVMMCDGPHGLRKQESDNLEIYNSIETVCYPTASALASSFDREAMTELGTLLGQECQAENVGMLLGPGLNMKRSPLCGRNFEYFSEDPYLAGELAASYISALQAQGVAACVKHFACNNQETRRMCGTSQVDERTLREIYLPAFEAAVKKGKTRSIMCAYNAINEEFCSQNHHLLTEILREDWGYEGFVVTDWGAVKDRVRGLKAGLDLEMPGGPGGQDKKIVQAVRDGTLDEAVLDRTVERLLTFIGECTEKHVSTPPFDREKAAAASGELEARCAVLLKNDGALPLQEGVDVVFLGDFARAPRYQGGGSSHINVPHPISALEAAEALGLPVRYARGYDSAATQDDPALFREAVDAARNAGTVVIFAGLPENFETEGWDRTSLAMPDNQNHLISAVAAVNPNTVVVLHGGSPMELPWLEDVKAVLCMYLGGSSVGTAAVKLLWGKANPSGHLAETWPRKLSDTPAYLEFPGVLGRTEYREGIFIGYRYYDKKEMDVLFPFGHGLSYTQFRYSGLTLDRNAMTDQETLQVRCTVENVGSRAGSEVVQLYVRDLKSTVQRPVRELKGFEKLHLLPGEKKVVTFRLDKRAFAYYETACSDWFVETGDFAIEVGASSRDLRCAATVHVTGTTERPTVFTRYSALEDVMATEKGRAVLSRFLPAAIQERQAQADTPGADVMTGIPLASLVTFAGVPEEALEALVAALNA